MQIRESVQKFVAFHNFGVGLNLSSLLDTLAKSEQAFAAKCEAQHSQNTPKQTAKRNYEATFKRLMQRMTDLLQDLLDCEV